MITCHNYFDSEDIKRIRFVRRRVDGVLVNYVFEIFYGRIHVNIFEEDSNKMYTHHERDAIEFMGSFINWDFHRKKEKSWAEEFYSLMMQTYLQNREGTVIA